MISMKGFKKVSENKNTATLAHPNGHKITVLVSKLTPVEKEALRRLDMHKGERENYDDGGPVESNSAANDEGSQDNQRQPASMRADQPPPPVQVTVNNGPAAQPQTPQPIQPQQPIKANAVQSAMTDEPQKNVMPPMPDTSPINTEAAPGAKTIGLKANKSILPGLIQEETALQQQEPISAKKAELEANEEGKLIQGLQSTNDQLAYAKREIEQHADDFAEQIKNIDPDRYRNQMSEPRKVMNAIGMLLGAGLGGNTQPAMDFLNKQIDRDVDAQKTNNQNKQNIFNAYEKLFHDQNIATNLTKASMIDIYDHNMKLAADRLGTPQALQAYNAASGALKVERGYKMNAAAVNLMGIKNGTIQQIPGASGQEALKQQQNLNGQGNGKGVLKKNLKTLSKEDSTILGPYAKQALQNVQYGGEKLREQYDKFQDAYSKVEAADQIASQLHKIHQIMYNDAKTQGSNDYGLGHFRRHDPLEKIPGIGEFMHQLVVAPIGANDKNKEYDDQKTRLTGEIINALRGTNISTDEIKKIVDDNSPEYRDKPEAIIRKERNIRAFIKNSVAKETALLGTQPGFLKNK